MRWWIRFSTPNQLGSAIASSLLMSVVASAAAQAVADGKPAPGAQPGSVLAPGVEVILKSTEVPLSDAGRLVSAQDHLTFVIEQTEPDRVLLVSTDKAVRGWLHPDHVVPLDKAVGYFGEVIASDRRNADAYWNCGRLLYYLNQDRRALTRLNSAIRLKPDQARYYLTRSLVFLRTERIDRSLDDCNKAIQFDPKSPLGYQLRAYAWLRKKDPDRASADLAQALKLDPTNPVGPVRTGPAAEEPLDSELDGIDEDPSSGGAAARPEPGTAAEFMARGNEWSAQKKYDRAISDYNAAIRLDPKHASAFAARAQAWASKHYRDKEAADCTEAIKLEPANATYWLARAESWSAQGMHDRAMDDYAEALRLEPKKPAIWVSRGNEWRRELKLDQAIADFTYAAQLDPRYVPAYLGRANTWKQRRDFARAIQEFSRLIQVDPQSPLAYQSLARILATTNEDRFRNGKWALDLATRACEMTHWRDPDCLDTLAAAYAETGDFPAAIKWQTEAIKLVRLNAPSLLQQRAQSFGGRRGVGFEDRLAYYKSKKTVRE